MKPDISNLRLDPQTLAVYQARARRARAQAVQNLTVRFIDWVSTRFGAKGGHPFGIRWG